MMPKREWSPDGAYAVFEAIGIAMSSAAPDARRQVLRALAEHGNELTRAFVGAPSALHVGQLLDRLRDALATGPAIRI